MKTRRTKLMLSASAVALSLALAGCGGGGGGPQSNLALNSGGSPQSNSGGTSAPVNSGGSPQNSGGSTSAGNNPVNTGGSPQSNGGSTSAGNDPVNTGGSPQNSGGSTSANNDPVNTGGSPQSNGGSTSAGNDPVNTGGSPQNSGGSTSANNDPVNTGGSPQSNTDDNNPVNTASNNNDNIGVSPGGDGPSRAQENTSPTAAGRAKAAAEAAEEKIDQAAQGPLTDYFQRRTLSKAMGVSRNTGAGDAVRAVSTIEREIAAVRRHLTTATNSATTLRTRADRLREAEAEHEMRLEAADDPKAAGNIHDLQKMLAEAEDAARHVENLVAGIDKDIQDIEGAAKAAEAGTCGHSPYQCPDGQPNLELAKEFRAQARTLKTMRHSYQPLDSNDEDATYTYAQLKSLAATKRRAADAEKRKVDAKQAEIDRLSERLIQAEEDTKMAEEAAANAEEAAGEIQKILKPLEDSLEVWEGVVAGGASALQSGKARLVLDLLADIEGNPGPAAPTDAISDLDTADYVFARASNKPARTMTFEDIANGNAEWVLHRRTFSDGTTVDTNAHTITGLPRNHHAIALSGLDTTVFVQQDGQNPSSLTYAPSTPGFVHGKLNGIDGTLYCERDGGCKTYTKSSTTEFLDGWYFTPAVNSSRQASLGYSPIETAYEDSDNDGTYEVVRYVEYGMWLTGLDEGGTKRLVGGETIDSRLTLHRRIGLVGPNSSRNLDFGTNTALDGSATYSGDAHGLSARTSGSRTASGHFTADVELNVTFGGTPLTAIRGTIDNFRPVSGQGSDHVDRRWSVSLFSPVPNNYSGGRIGGDVTITAPDGDGDWGWTPYGEFQERPAGFYGDFDVEFYDDNTDATNGAAAGLYHVEKQ